MRKVLKLLITSLLVVFSAMVLEQLCYRFSWAYAIWRADWVWREHDSKGIAMSVLRHLPLSQWANPPAGNDVVSDGDAKGESLYAERILSYTRPLRDDLYEHSQLGDMHEFEVRAIGGIKDMALPRLTVSATSEDVSEGKARRVGEKLPMTKAILLHVLPLKEDFGEGELSDQRRERERQFVSFLDRGIGCGIIHVSSSDELLDAVGKLREEEKRLATKVLAWGKGKSASCLAEAVSRQPKLWAGVVLESPEPDSFLKTSPPLESPWILTLLSLTGGEREGYLAGKMIEWARAGRQGTLPLASRMGGLFHLSIPSSTPDLKRSPENQAFGDAFLIECVERIDQGTDGVEHGQPLAELPRSMEEPARNPFPVEEKTTLAQEPFDFFHPRENNPQPDGLSELPVPPEQQVSYDCKVLRDYRALKIEKPELQNMENRDLILKLGKMFESGGMLEEIRKRDEFFVLYYKSLRALEASP